MAPCRQCGVVADISVADDIRNRFVTRVIRALPAVPDPSAPSLSAAEKFAAKRANELTRATATLFNNLAVGTIIAGVLSPWASGRTEPWWATMILLLAATVLHSASRAALWLFLKREE